MYNQMWRAVAVYRIVTLCYAAVLIVSNDSQYAHPVGGYLALVAMAAWTAITVIAYSRPSGRSRWLIITDVAVATGLIVCTRLIDTPYHIQHGAPTIPVIWAASAILACAVAGGPWAGMAAAVPIWVGDLIERNSWPTESL